jgi:hypothetical protein
MNLHFKRKLVKAEENDPTKRAHSLRGELEPRNT